MNLFFIARNLPTQTRVRALMVLRGMTAVYPLLDPKTFKSFGGKRLFAGFMHTSAKAAAPRRYAAGDGDRLTFYDGCAVDASGGLTAHDAGQLAAHWETLPERLEGQFFAARLDGRAGVLELLSDPLGMHQTFYWRSGERLIISNSVRLISAVMGLDEIDEEAASQFLGLGYVGGERTLVQGIRAFPPGERWVLRESGPIERQRYFSLAELARLPRAPLSRQATARLADELGAMLKRLNDDLGAFQCPITAGRDSRMMVGLTMANHLPAEYFSTGEEANPDVTFGRRIAETFKLPHQVKGREVDVAEVWHEASWRLLQQNDGLVTLAHIQNATGEPRRLERLKVHLYGAGGEIARGDLLSERFLLMPQTRRSVEAHICAMLRQNGRLLTPAVAGAAKRHVHATVGQLLEQGFALKDIPDAFFLHDGLRRWGGAQFRQVGSYRDVFSPFCTRPYVRAAFSLPLALRHNEHLPYRLLEHLSPELHALPFEKPWLPQHPAQMMLAHLAKAPFTLTKKAWGRLSRTLLRRPAPAPALGRGAERHGWLEQRLAEVRTLCLAQADSPLWRLIDRDAFARLTAPETSVAERKPHAAALFQALTMLHYGLLQGGALDVSATHAA